jgi:hypothetical protein
MRGAQPLGDDVAVRLGAAVVGSVVHVVQSAGGPGALPSGVSPTGA